MEKFNKPLNMRKMNDVEKRAYKSWKDQGQRCTNENDPRYYCYGAVGIKREYDSRSFISWYVSEFNKVEKWNRPNVDRIDSKKNYCFENIRLIECSENVKLRNMEHGNPSDSKRVRIVLNGVCHEYESLRLASRESGYNRPFLKRRLNDSLNRKKDDGLIVEWIR